MRVAKPLLLGMTALAGALGLVEAYRVAGEIVVDVAALIVTLSVAILTVVREERRKDPGPK